MVVNRFVFAATITGIVIYIEVTILQTTYNLGIETFTAATESTSLTQLEVLELAMTVASTFTREFLLGLLVAALLFLTFWRGSFTTIVTPWGAISLNPKDRDNPLFDMDYLPEKMEIIVTMDTVVTEVMERLDAIEEPAITDVILECSLVYFKKKGVELRTVNVTNDSSKFLGFTTKYIPINYDDTTYYSYYSENKEIDDMDLFILKSFIYEVIVCNQKTTVV